jgi:predicted SAM-dependent methyltransferase
MQLNKIHLACGNNLYNGWDNYDYFPTNGANHINLLEPLPFKNNSIDYIYFEHALEHFDEVDGYSLLQQFFNILKPMGIVRIVTPSLDTYLERYNDWSSASSEHKQKFHNETQFLNFAFFGENISDDIKFLNGMKSQQVGHKFLYSKVNLIQKLQKIGFSINMCKYNISEYEELKNLESRPDYKDIIIEATKNV